MITETAYELHELATIFPEMDAEAFAAFKDSIARNGQKTPIILYQEKIIDGRHRYRACQELGIECQVTEYLGNDPVQVVRDNNMNDHRHLTDSQRAFCGARLENVGRGGDRGNQYTGGKSSSAPLPILSSGEPTTLITRTAAAEMMDVSPMAVKRAAVVLRHGTPEVQQAAESGDITLSSASEVARLPKEEQQKITSAPNVKVAAREAVNRRSSASAFKPIIPASHRITVSRVLGGDIVEGRQSDNEVVGESVFLYPGDKEKDILQALQSVVDAKNDGLLTQAIIATPALTDAKWFHAVTALSSAVCLTLGRLGFYDSKGTPAPPDHGHAFFYFGTELQKFRQFAQHGIVLYRHPEH